MVIADYDPSWPAAFAAEAARVTAALAGQVLGVEHIGSTAVEWLAAKPVIDIQVGVPTLEVSARIVEAVERIGYLYMPELEQELHRQRGVYSPRRVHRLTRALRHLFCARYAIVEDPGGNAVGIMSHVDPTRRAAPDFP